MSVVTTDHIRWIRRPWGVWHGFYRIAGHGYDTRRTAVTAMRMGNRWALQPHQIRADINGIPFDRFFFFDTQRELFLAAPRIIQRRFNAVGAWALGPWDHEPDRIDWQHRSGLELLMLRSYLGAWCGYVGIPPEHTLFGKRYLEVEGLEVHGGLTFSGKVDRRALWWFGFDCAHAWDLAPGLDLGLIAGEQRHSLHQTPWIVYRDEQYVRAQVESLADQLAERGHWSLAEQLPGHLH